jgi:putative Mn2+ efflux pump MntP
LVWKLLAFVLPLGLDSFAVAAALGARRPSGRQRWRLSALFVVFEAGMPLVGLAIGAPVAHLIGSAAEYVAAVVLAATGAWMIFSDDDNEKQAAGRLLSAGGWAAIVLGLSISLDELAIGFTIGLARLPVVWVIVAIGVQAFIASQLGFAVGVRIGEVWRERAERLAGLMLILLGAGLVVAKLRASL